MSTSPPETPQSPIGNTVMDTRVLKEPRGFMRCIEWFFAIIAFACCCDFSSYVQYTVECTNGTVQHIKNEFYYPFQLDHVPGKNVTCGPTTRNMYLPGDFSSDAQFFVFTGVIAFLGTMAVLAVYVFFSEMYFSESKRGPMIDFCFTVIVAVFWLSASAAWANGVINMKYAANPNNFLFNDKMSICQQQNNGYVVTNVKKCTVDFLGNFKKANVSVIVGFLNFFLWTSNLWFLYKETSWFSGSQPQAQQQQA